MDADNVALIEQEEAEVVCYEGVNADGFGVIARMATRDPDLSIEAKGIYAYFCSLAGGGCGAVPSRKAILKELGISKDRYYKHRNLLISKGYIRIERVYKMVGRTPVGQNAYVIAQSVPKEGLVQTPEATQGSATEEMRVFNNEEPAVEKKPTATPGQDVCPCFKDIGDETGIVENPSFEQSPGQDVCPCFKDVRKTRTPIIRDDISIPKIYPIDKSIHPINQPGSLPGSEDGDYERLVDEVVRGEFAALCAASVNRNRLADGWTDYRNLRKAFPADTVLAAWEAEQGRCEGREARFYTQLARWLSTHAAADCRRIAARKAEKARRERQSMFRKLYAQDAVFRDLVDQDMVCAGDLNRSGESDASTRERIAKIASILDSAVSGKRQVGSGVHVAPDET